MRHSEPPATRPLSGVLAPVALAAIACVAAPAGSARNADDPPTRLLRQPAVSARHVAFAYAGDLWIAGRDGGDATRLTSFPGVETRPCFSPDGAWLAFAAEYDGNTDVYILPVEGGSPRRLTWHPGDDIPASWSADGSAIYFASSRTAAPFDLIERYWSVPRDGGLPTALPMPEVYQGSFDAAGKRFAYNPVTPWESEFRGYRGGQNRPIWLLTMHDYSLRKLPWEGSRDESPVWIGDTIYFLSDRDWAMNVWAFDTRTDALRQITSFDTFDVKSLSAGGGLLAIEQGGALHLIDPSDPSPRARRLDIRVRGDLPWARPHWKNVGDALTHPALSPTGKRAVFEARGEILTVPVEEGDDRNLTRSPGVADRAPVWSPDGTRIAWFSDAGGEYALHVADQSGLGEPERIPLADPTFYFTPAWSPDSRFVLFTDEGLHLSYVDVETGRQTRIDTDAFAHPSRTMDPVWSPDSRWIAYAKRMDNQYHSILVYSLEDGSIHAVTDGMSDAVSPAFDRGGKYLYFLASTNFALASGWLDMSSYERDVRRALYFAVLDADDPSPLLPKSDEEPGAAADEGADGKPTRGEDKGKDKGKDKGQGKQNRDGEGDEEEIPRVAIDFEGIGRRILSLSVPERTYAGLFAGPADTVFYAETVPNAPGFTLRKIDLEKQEPQEFVSGATSATVSQDGKKLLYGNGSGWFVVDTAAPPNPGDGALKTASLQVKVDPRAEWKQIFREAWRFERDFFYVENVHGADLPWLMEAYGGWVDDVGHRSDLTYLLDILGGETSVGHSFAGGGDLPDVDSVPVGLLGADLERAGDRYRLRRIYSGESWNPGLRAPLSGPGIDAREGDFILEIEGRELRVPQNPFALLEGRAERQTRLKLAATADGKDAREVTVVPVADEAALRRHAWVEGNRRKVDALSDGKLAYVWLPNTGGGGYANFNRYYFAQQDKLGAVIDERWNTGGSAADYIVDILDRDLQGFFNNPVGEHRPFTNPGAGIWGPKVMIVNQSAGSGGDLMPWMFRNMGIGPLIGTRTWGGLVGIWDVPPLIDGGFITAPRGGFYTNDGVWAVENEGVPPDIEVEQTPREVIAGHDPQLEAAVAEALRLLESYDGPGIVPQPPDPVRVRRPASGAAR